MKLILSKLALISYYGKAVTKFVDMLDGVRDWFVENPLPQRKNEK